MILSDIKRRKFSSFLTFFAISLGIASIYLIFLLTLGLGESFVNQFDEFGANRLYVSSTSSSLTSNTQTKGLTDNDISFIESRPYVDTVYPYYFKNYQVEYGNDFEDIRLIGTILKDDYFLDYNLDIEEGRFTKETEKYSLIVGSLATTEIFERDLKVGSNVYIEDTKFKIVGVLESVGNPEDDKAVYANIDTLREIDGAGDDVGVFDVLIVQGYDINLAKSNLQTILDNKFGEDEVDVISTDQVLGVINNLLSYINIIFGGIGVISLIVGSLGIINTMFLIVTEKTKEIGIMKSVGASNFNILTLFVLQSGFFGFLGAIIGIIFGFGLLKIVEFVMVNILLWTFVTFPFDMNSAIGLTIFGFVIGCIAGFIPAYRASQINVVEALRK